MRYFPWYDSANGRPARPKSEEDIMKFYAEKHDMEHKYEVVPLWGLPVPFWITRLLVTILIFFWAGLLISVLALKKNAWYLIGAGTIGMMQNAIVAAASRKPETRGVPLKLDPRLFIGSKVMDVLMGLENLHPGCGKALCKEFFPAGHDSGTDRGEQDWWDAKAQGVVAANPHRDMHRYERDRYKLKYRGKRYDGPPANPDEPIKQTRGTKKPLPEWNTAVPNGTLNG